MMKFAAIWGSYNKLLRIKALSVHKNKIRGIGRDQDTDHIDDDRVTVDKLSDTTGRALLLHVDSVNLHNCCLL